MNKKVKTTIFGTVGAVFSALFICATILLPHYSITIDKFFLGQGIDTSSYDSQASKDYSVVIENEGQVLLKNDNNVLPLTATEDNPAKVSVFGIRAGNMKFTGSGSGGGDVTNAIQLDDALAESNISVYQDLFDYYQSFDSTGDEGGFDVIGKDPNSAEISPSQVSASLLEGAKAYSDTALYVIGRVGAEEGYLSAEDLCLSVYEEDTLDYIVENFENVIVLLNTSNAYECGFIEGKGISRNSGEDLSKYAGKIDAALWVGCPGLVGSLAIGEVLSGTTNPSGRLIDTYAYDNMSCPAANNVDSVFFSDNKALSYSSYVEGIYTGYKWYETAAYEGAIDYDDYSGNTTVPYTDDTISTGVMYPFGYGLSYTSFTWEMTNSVVEDDNIKLTVKVTNTGSVAGKDVVEVYFTPPYTEGGIEKAYVNLIDFEKTDLIEPGQSDTVEISFPIEDMKSYDYDDANNNGFKGYELEKGNYYIRLLKNAHEWESVGTNSSLCYTYTVNETVQYAKDSVTGNTVENRFGDQSGGIEYISRENNFANLSCAKVDSTLTTTDFTDANGDTGYVLSTQETYSVPSDEVNDYTQYEDYEVTLDTPITLEEMRTVAKSDEKWDTFVSQLTKSEMCTIIAKANFETIAVERLGIPYCILSDGPSGIKSTYEGDSCVCFPSTIVLASTWNKEVAQGYGEHVAADARAVGVSTWYAPSINVHRSAFESRCFEYYSECSMLTARMSSVLVKYCRDNGLIASIKHLILYGNGTFQWCNEQALREYYLLPFEKCVKDGNALSMMSTSNLFGVFCGRSKELMTDVLRTEWGFEGFVTTDAAGPGFLIEPSIRAGNDLWLASDSSFYKTLIKDKNIGVIKNAVKNYLFAVSRSTIALNADVEGLSWSPSIVIMTVLDIVSVGVVALCVIVIIRTWRKKEI